jgi:arylsulfatase A-like enzyme
MKQRKEKYFAFLSLSDLSHDDFNNVGYVDRPTHKLMTKLFEENLMEDTVIFFFSDHGLRFGPIRATHSGEIEVRLPFMLVYLPSGYMHEYRDILSINQYRLTTAFDIHSTLLHILNGESIFIIFQQQKNLFLSKIKNRIQRSKQMLKIIECLLKKIENILDFEK